MGGEYFDRVVYVGLFNTPVDDAWIDSVNRREGITTLLLSGEEVTDTPSACALHRFATKVYDRNEVTSTPTADC